MSFTAILFALLLEQVWPLATGNGVHAVIRHWIQIAQRYFDTGGRQHAGLAWGFAVAIPAILALSIYWGLVAVLGWWAGVIWSVAVLYACVGFRQFSHHFTAIRDALEAGDEELARQLLSEWRSLEARPMPRQEIVRQVMEHSVIAAHRHVLGVLAWFSLFALLGCGPAGAVFYRLSEFVPRYWKHQSAVLHQPVSQPLLMISSQIWRWVDWIPVRITALGFAVVGSFEESVDAWRAYSLEAGPSIDNDAIILAASSGAINVQLGVQGTAAMADVTGPTVQRQEPQLGHLRSLVGLVWRSVVLWMILLALLSLARLLG